MQVNSSIMVARNFRVVVSCMRDAYTPQQNGVVERRHRHILETARAIMFQGILPNRFSGLCVEAAVYILNRIPSTVLSSKSNLPHYYS